MTTNSNESLGKVKYQFSVYMTKLFASQASSAVLLNGTAKTYTNGQVDGLDDAKIIVLPEVKVAHYDKNEETTCVD